MTLEHRHALAATLEELAALLRAPEPTIVCGETDPDPRVEARIVAVRQANGAPDDDVACGKRLVWRFAYRCAECGRWFHRECLLKHFAAHRTPEEGR